MVEKIAAVRKIDRVTELFKDPVEMNPTECTSDLQSKTQEQTLEDRKRNDSLLELLIHSSRKVRRRDFMRLPAGC